LAGGFATSGFLAGGFATSGFFADGFATSGFLAGGFRFLGRRLRYFRFLGRWLDAVFLPLVISLPNEHEINIESDIPLLGSSYWKIGKKLFVLKGKNCHALGPEQLGLQAYTSNVANRYRHFYQVDSPAPASLKT
jgi:hypothetical protein